MRRSGTGLVSRGSPVQTAMRNCTRDEGRSFEFGNQVLISSHRELLLSKAMVVAESEMGNRLLRPKLQRATGASFCVVERRRRIGRPIVEVIHDPGKRQSCMRQPLADGNSKRPVSNRAFR